jgi:hyperosmotically inducible periplasmic protein
MRTIIRVFLVVVLLVLVGFATLDYWTRTSVGTVRTQRSPNGAASPGTIDAEEVRERGAQVGEKAAIAAGRVKETVSEAALTTKIKAKMALDDSVKARAIDVTTQGTSVTVSGTVASSSERERAVALARETAGVTQVIDRLQVRQ